MSADTTGLQLRSLIKKSGELETIAGQRADARAGRR